MESIKAPDSPNAAADSSFIMRINEEECIGCGDCVERCQVDAITLEGDKAVQTVGRCIGCGLCISTCTSGALELIKRGASPEPPRTLPELTVAMIASYQQRKREKAKETA